MLYQPHYNDYHALPRGHSSGGDTYRPLMPFKFHYHIKYIVIEFTFIVAAVRLIATLTLWVWLYTIALLLSHYNGPLFFDNI